MPLREQGTQVEQVENREYFSLRGKNLLKFISSLFLPLMLGIFTVVVTFEQQKVARLQRLEDKNESRLQREQDWNIAQLAQAAQNKAISDQYQDAVLIAYIKEMADLLERKGGSLTSDSLSHTLARVKTLNAIRQLDGARQIYILRFLHEAGQLTNTNETRALDISTAELVNIDFRKSGQLLASGETSLAGIYLVNSTFSGILLKNVNFSSAHFTNVNFSSAEFEHVNFSNTKFSEVNFSNSKFSEVNFSSATFINTNFSSSELTDVNFSSAVFKDVDFSSIRFINGDFSTARFDNVNFLSALIDNTNFSSALLYNVDFASGGYSNNDYSSAWLDAVNFSSGAFSDINFSRAMFSGVNFSSALFLGHFGTSRFDYAKLPRTVFDRCFIEETSFNYANLKYSSFRSVTFGAVSFSFTILQETDFTNSTITDYELRSALSIRNAKLPNGALGKGRNLVKNGDANCSIPLTDHWRVENGTIEIVAAEEHPNQCRFTLRSVTIGSVMSQRIDLVNIWNSSNWTRWNIELDAQMSHGVSIELIGKNKHGIPNNARIANATYNTISMKLSANIQTLEVIVKFDAVNGRSEARNSWCDNIELFIDYEP